MADQAVPCAHPGSLRLASGGRRQSHYDVLVGRFPSLTASLDMTYHNYLAAHGSGGERIPAWHVGQQAAAGIIVLRAQ